MPDSADLPVPGRLALRSGFAAGLARRSSPLLVGATGVLLGSVPAAVDGGFFSDSWAWLALVSLAVATLRLILVSSTPLRLLDWAFVGGFAAFAGWVALSALWAPAVTPAVDETIRNVAYGAVVLALLLVVRRSAVETLLLGALLGVTVISSYALLTRLQPDWVGNWNPSTMFRLTGTMGYWNGLGVYAAMGLLLSLGLVARSRSLVVRAVAGATPVLLAPTILFTFSRGAWAALAVGLVAVVLLDARRSQLILTGLVLAAWPALAIGLAVGSDHLTRSDVTLQQAADEGGRLLVWIVVLASVSALASLLLGLADARVRVPAAVSRGFSAAIAVAAVAAAVAVFSIYGSPWTLADRAIDQISRRPAQVSVDVTDRLFDLSANGRLEQWRVSLDQFRSSPVLGDGAGTWAAAWNRDRPYDSAVLDAHSLYLEALGELGVIGLAVLVLALSLPLLAAVRARRSPITVAAFGAYVAFLGHAAVDWDWELAGVTMIGLVSAASLLILARPDDEEPERDLGVPARIAVPSVTGLLTLLALAAVLSTVPLGRAYEAYNRLDFDEAAKQAQKAADWAPWSSKALDILGRAQMAQGQLVKARASFAEAVDRSPNDWELWRDLAAASPLPEARRAIDTALRLNPLEGELVQIREQFAAAR